MAINKITGSINVSDSGDDSVKVISQLGDRPNQDNNLTAAELKAKFDAAAVIIGNFVNTVKTTVNQIIDVVNRLNFTTGTAGFLKTNSAGTVSVGAITSSDIPAKAITTAKLDDGAVTADQLATGAVTADRLATDAVETAKIKNNAVTNSKMASQSVMPRCLGGGMKPVYVVTTAPTSASDDGVYLVVGS